MQNVPTSKSLELCIDKDEQLVFDTCFDVARNFHDIRDSWLSSNKENNVNEIPNRFEYVEVNVTGRKNPATEDLCNFRVVSVHRSRRNSLTARWHSRGGKSNCSW